MCIVCGVPSASPASDCCGDRDCQVVKQRWQVREQADQDHRSQLRLEAQATQLRDELAPSAQIERPADYLVAIIPHAIPLIGEQTPDRVQALRNHLGEQMQQAVEHPRPVESFPTTFEAPQLPDSAENTLHNACRICKGHCCRRGATHGFLTADDLRRVQRDNLELSPHQILQQYVDKVPSRVVLDSCVFHGEFGCTLPRSIRSNLCNNYLCRDLNRVRQTLNENPGQQFFFASEKHDTIWSAEFVHT